MKTLLSCLLMVASLFAVPVAVTNVAAETTSQASTVAAAKVAINSATVEQLQALPGIGPAIAQRIVDYRTANGAFASKKDLLKVRGIGPAILAKIQNFIDLN